MRQLAVLTAVSLISLLLIASAFPAGLQDQLVAAIKKEDPERFRDLVCRGADPFKPDSKGKAPLDHARFPPMFERMAKDIKDHDLCRRDVCGEYPELLLIRSEIDDLVPPDMKPGPVEPRIAAVCMACWKGNTSCVERLIKEGVDPDAACPEFGTLLTRAACRGHSDLVTLLLDRGAHLNINVPDGPYGTPALMHAIKALKEDSSITPQGPLWKTIEILLQRGADPNAKADLCDRILHYAAAEGNSRLVMLLLRNGADPNIQNDIKETPVMMAAKAGHLDVLLLLLNKGASLNHRSDPGDTALSVARKKGHLELVRALLDLGAQ
jgi:hypothetical protein